MQVDPDDLVFLWDDIHEKNCWVAIPVGKFVFPLRIILKYQAVSDLGALGYELPFFDHFVRANCRLLSLFSKPFSCLSVEDGKNPLFCGLY